MAEAVKMTVVDGIRYRPEHAPTREQAAEPEKAASAPNKARKTASNKAESPED
jgi:hypothetical protein